MFISDARPVFYVNVARHPVVKSPLQHAEVWWYFNVIVVTYAMCYECVMNVLWICYECVMNVLWMCYGCVMDVIWMCYGCVMGVLWVCYGCVMDVLWMCCVMGVLWVCYGCVMDVLWMCEVCYGCVRYAMDVLRMYAWWMNDGYFISTV